MRRFLLLALVAAWLTPGLALAEDNQVYVEDFSVSGANASLQGTLARQFQAALMAANPSFKAFTRQDLRNLLKREEYKEVVACTESSCVTEIITNYGIALSAFGVVQAMGGGDCEVTVRVFDREEPKCVASEIVRCTAWELMAMVKGLAGICAGKLAGDSLPQQQAAPPPGAVERDKYGIEWVPIPTGMFQMGCTPRDRECEPIELGRHPVTIRGFLLMKYEVTQGQYQQLVGANPSKHGDCGVTCPVEFVTWSEAKAFCGLVGGRLPTEAEWEFAARAGTTNLVRYGELDEIAWFNENSGLQPHPVGQKQPNPWGLYDMLGNVDEWIEDYYHDSYSGAPGDGTAWSVEQYPSRVLRGGNYYFGDRQVRVSARSGTWPGSRQSTHGIRCARALPHE